MKKIYFSLMLLCAMAFTSCSMDQAPYGSLDDQTAIERRRIFASSAILSIPV